MISKLLKKLRKRNLKNDKTLLQKEKKCDICNKELKNDIRKLGCGHMFHGDCIDYAENIFYVFCCWRCGRHI